MREVGEELQQRGDLIWWYVQLHRLLAPLPCHTHEGLMITVEIASAPVVQCLVTGGHAVTARALTLAWGARV